MEDKIIKLAEYETLYEAEYAKDVLKANGINAVVVGDSLQGVGPYMSQPNLNCIEVLVFEADLKKATEILENAAEEELNNNDEDEVED